MSMEQGQRERRSCQRFDLHLPVQVRLVGTERTVGAFTQNLSVRGALLYCDLRLDEGSEVELILVMPPEITLAESMRVRCRGKVVRATTTGLKSLIAVQVEKYEFLPQADEATPQFNRISALHERAREEEVRSGRIPQRPLARF